MKNSGSFQISAQNKRLWYLLKPPLRGGFNEYPQSIFMSRNKKTNVYPVLLYKSGVLGGKTIKDFSNIYEMRRFIFCSYEVHSCYLKLQMTVMSGFR